MATIYKKLREPKPSLVFDTYWKFAAKRQEIFFKRFQSLTAPWTDDHVLMKHKFTNAYRASDRVSQYLIKNIIYSGDQSSDEVFFRIILFKTFNKIETWELLKHELGDVSYKDYSFKKYNNVLDKAMRIGKSIYSGAYIMTSGKSAFGFDRKHHNHLKLIELLMNDRVPDKISSIKTMEDLYLFLKSYPTIGNFLAYQYLIDINYSNLTSFSEMDFVVAGPGAKDGIKKCFTDFGDYSEADIIKYVTDTQQGHFKRLELDFKNLWGRDLQLIDCQNLFCEVDKYSRIVHPDVQGISNRKKIKQLFNCNKQQVEYFYPPKWGLNQKIRECYEQT